MPEKLGVQLAKTESNYRKIQTLKNNHSSVIVGIGSLVITNKANYYIAISLGVCKFGDESCYCISPESPIGNLLLGKKLGEIIDFNNVADIPKPSLLFVHLLLDTVFAESSSID